MCVA